METTQIDRRRKAARTTKRWEPKNWKPIYDRVVGYAVIGKSNIEIAELVNKTPTWVSNILTCEQGVSLYNALKSRIKGKVESDVDRMGGIADIAVKNLETVISNEELLQKYPFKMADLSSDFLKGIGKLKPERESTTNNNMFFGVPMQLQNQLMEGLEVANQAKRLHKGRNLGEVDASKSNI